ncbi:Antitoxin component of the MazEF toxin-antitoxin module [Limimonas halophila]|uniref:Antitoxin component of the MazEF toxin-antitoxin module n=2 Tax=Limimonas halophila TaxID=1082479 RepID=A0A1G7LGF3_9PROT|nr:Antitoxin component of the MazEF toxin-antitoxin module [Limimonas halophila]
MPMRATIAKWVEIVAVRLPDSVAKQMDVHEDSAVELAVEDHRLTVTPARPRYTLDEVLAGATPAKSIGVTPRRISVTSNYHPPFRYSNQDFLGCADQKYKYTFYF